MTLTPNIHHSWRDEQDRIKVLRGARRILGAALVIRSYCEGSELDMEKEHEMAAALVDSLLWSPLLQEHDQWIRGTGESNGASDQGTGNAGFARSNERGAYPMLPTSRTWYQAVRFGGSGRLCEQANRSVGAKHTRPVNDSSKLSSLKS